VERFHLTRHITTAHLLLTEHLVLAPLLLQLKFLKLQVAVAEVAMAVKVVEVALVVWFTLQQQLELLITQLQLVVAAVVVACFQEVETGRLHLMAV
jgi:hypothetical protein